MNHKGFLHGFTSVALISSSLFSVVPVKIANASEVVTTINSSILLEEVKTIAPGITQTNQTLTTNFGPLKSYEMSVDPTQQFVEVEAGLSNDQLAGFETLTNQAKRLAQQGKTVVGGVNGDFFNTSNGIPVEGMVHDGELIKTGGGRSSFNVLKDGSVSIGKLSSTVTASNDIGLISGVNTPRGTDQLVLYTDRYASSTGTNEFGSEVILEVSGDALQIGNEITVKVKEVMKNEGNNSLAENQWVLSGNGVKRELLEKLEVGTELTLTVNTAEPYSQVEESVAGYHEVVVNGEVQNFTDQTRHPRTAVGVKSDGSFFFYVVDGRQPGVSEGLTLQELGEHMKERGAVQAINMDGGGSATMIARNPGEASTSVQNVPSDGSERGVANSLLLVTTAPTTTLSKLYVTPQQSLLYKESSMSFEVKGQDSNDHPAEIKESITWSATEGIGGFEGTIFTAGNTASTGDITAKSGEVTGKATVQVVDKVDELKLSQSAVAVGSGETITVNPTVYKDGRVVKIDKDAFTYETTNNIGEISSTGEFKGIEGVAKGQIIVSLDDLEQTIDVEVGKEPIIVEDFEDGVVGWNKSGARFNSIDITEAIEPAPVRFGSKSMKLSYDFEGQKGTSGAYASPAGGIILEGYPEKLGMWVHGNNDGHWLRAQLRDGNNAAFPLDFTAPSPGVDWEGWKYIEVAIPKGKVTPLKIDMAMRVMQTSDAKKNAGAIYVDNIRAVYGPTNDDLKNPLIEMETPKKGSKVDTTNPEISVFISDDETGIDPSKTKLYVDNQLVQHNYNEETGEVSFEPEKELTGGYHEVKIQVKDKFENPSELVWGFEVTNGPQLVMDVKEALYAGESYELVVNGKEFTNLESNRFTIMYDSSVVSVDEKTVKTLASEHVKELSFHPGSGEITLETSSLPTKVESLLTVPFTVKEEALADVVFSLKNAIVTYKNGDAANTFVQPIVRPVSYKYSLEAKGLATNSATTLVVKDDKGKLAKNIGVMVENTENYRIGKIITETPVYKTSNLEGETLTSAPLNSKWYVKDVTETYAQVLDRQGQNGYVALSSIEVSNFPQMLGETDDKGEITTNLLTLSNVVHVLFAKKDNLVSKRTSMKVVAALGEEKPEHITLSWTENPKTSQTITWRTSPFVKTTEVEFVESDDFTTFEASNVKNASGENQLLADKAGEMNIHRTVVKGLKPGTSYTYRVGDGQANWSEKATFTTETSTEEPFTFLFTADSQAANEAGNKVYGDLLKGAITKYPEAKFILHGGDLVDDAALMSQWESFRDAKEGIVNHYPFHAVLGNHDVYGDGEHIFKAFYANPSNGPTDETGWVYSYDYGDVHFAMLNSEFGSDSMRAQMDWLRKDMKATNKPWKVVMFHRAPYHSNPLRGEDATRSIFAPVIEELDIDLALVGHDHAYARTFPMKKGQKTDAANGTTYIIGGSSGPKFYPEEKYEYVEFLYGEDKQVYTAISIEGKELKITTTNSSGEVVDEHVLQQKVRTSSDSGGNSNGNPPVTEEGVSLEQLGLTAIGSSKNISKEGTQLNEMKWTSSKEGTAKAQVVEIDTKSTGVPQLEKGKLNSSVYYLDVEKGSDPIQVAVKIDKRKKDFTKSVVYHYDVEKKEWTHLRGTYDKKKEELQTVIPSSGLIAMYVVETSFTDVKENHWAQNSIQSLAAHEVVNGYGKTFDPSKDITRAEFIKIVVEALQLENKNGAVPFTDVSSNKWYYNYIETAYQNGIVNGTGQNRFLPESKISREEMFSILVRSLYGDELTASSEIDNMKTDFVDANEVSKWAEKEMAVAVEKGLVKGNKQQQLSPISASTRAEVAMSVYRILFEE